MVALAVLALVLFTGSTFAASSDASRIVGGWPTTIERYPSIVQVDFRGVFSGTWGQSCAANILNTRYVVSAAHCFEGILYAAENRRIRAGSTLRNAGGIHVYVEREFNHPVYGTNGFDSDITVVRLISPLEFSPVIQPIAIIAQGTRLPDGLPVQHAGWGATSVGGAASPELLETSIFTVNHEICASRYRLSFPPRVVTENMICAGLLDIGGRDACQGDSGGPLYYDDPVYGDILVGIVSWGEQCALARFPGVSVAVSSYTQWIASVAV